MLSEISMLSGMNMLADMKLNEDTGYQNRPVRCCQDALIFDGYSIWLSGAYEPLKEAESFTLSFEVAFWGVSSPGDSIFSCRDSKNNQGISIKITKEGQIRAEVGLGTQTLSFSSINAHPVRGRWNRILFIFQNPEGWCDLVINGVLSNRAQFPRFTSVSWPESPVYIGRNTDEEDGRLYPQMGCFWGLIRRADFYDYAFPIEKAKKESSEPAPEEPPVYRTDRSVYDGDADRPQYHLIAPEKWMNEPHAPVYFDGFYHIFYQANLHAPVWDQIQWGHLASRDMIHWKDLPLALETDQNGYDRMGCWSGSALVDKDNTPRIYYTAGDDRRFPNQAVAMAKARNAKEDHHLTLWDKYPKLVQIQNTGWPGEFRDPFVWLEGDTYFMLVGTGDAHNGGGNAALYSSDDGISWQSHGMILEYDFEINQEVGHVWELPVLLPLRNTSGEIVCHILLLCACQIENDIVETYYFTGKWDPEAKTFTSHTKKAQLFDLGHGTFTGSSGLVTPDGRSAVFTIAQGRRKFSEEYYAGWAHNGGLPLSLWWEDGLRMEPVQEVLSCRGKQVLDLTGCTPKEAQQELAKLEGNRFFIEIETSGNHIELQTKNDRESRTVIYDRKQKHFYAVDDDRQILSRNRGEVDAVDIADEPICLSYFLDHSMIEVYLNKRKAMTLRNYAGSGTRRIRLEDTDGTILKLTAWEMNSAYGEE